jgi:DNA-binding MarR family transcriptional regulator
MSPQGSGDDSVYSMNNSDSSRTPPPEAVARRECGWQKKRTFFHEPHSPARRRFAGCTALPVRVAESDSKCAALKTRFPPNFHDTNGLSHTFEGVRLSSMQSVLSPTLWRTCRALANRKRLRMLRHLLSRKAATVASIAELCAVEPDKASLMLRQLQARGLLSARRSGRLVVYSTVADAQVHGARDLLAALRATLHSDAEHDAAFHLLTAFTHPRRIMLVRALGSRCICGTDLQETCSMSRPSFYRHIAKLKKRGFVEGTAVEYRLSCPNSRLARSLLQLACSR